MSLPRIYQAFPLNDHETIQLDQNAAHHLGNVLRSKIGDPVIIFNGKEEYQAEISHLDKKTVRVLLKQKILREVESPLNLYLAQGISRGEKMDFTIQKAVELGVKGIFPIITERCNVKLAEDRLQKRMEHWRGVIISACEQSGRVRIPTLTAPQKLSAFITNLHYDFKFILAPTADRKLKQMQIPPHSSVLVLIGPEGGLSNVEIEIATQAGCLPLKMGERILRTETAGLVALSILQFYAGDLG